MNIFVTFSNDYYAETRDYACKMALEKGLFDKVACYKPEDIDSGFANTNKKILETKYGAGLWLWKPYFINKVMTEVAQDGDYVFYCDAASYFIKDCKLIIDEMKRESKNILACATPLLEKYFTKEQTFVGLNCTESAYRDTNQFHASFMCFRKCKGTVTFVSEWLQACCNYDLMAVEPTLLEYPNPSYFVAHRQDQSIFSLLCKKYKIEPSFDPSQYGILQDWYAIANIEFRQINLKKVYPVCIYLHKTRAVESSRIKTIRANLLLPSFIRTFLAKRRLKQMHAIVRTKRRMKTIMIWNDTLVGHHLEYLNHIHEAAINADAIFIFVLPDNFSEVKQMMTWTQSQNIKFDLMSSSEIQSLKGGYLSTSYKRSKCIRKYALKHNADEIYLNTLCLPYPLLPLILPRRINVSGIIYQIYFYKWNKMPITEKIKYVIETWSMANSSCTKHPLVLNDVSAANYFNKIYQTDKYLKIVDPVVVSNKDIKCDRSKYAIPNDSIMFFHFGAMDARKGTLDVLEAISLLSEQECQNKMFVFAGKVNESIADEFYMLFNQAKIRGINIVVYDTFCEYSMLDELCYLSDYLLIPYRFTELSSGVIGHSAKYGKRLIGPAEGVIGKLIKQSLGNVAIKQLTPQKLAVEISHSKKYSSEPNYIYLSKNSIKSFQDNVIDALLSE